MGQDEDTKQGTMNKFTWFSSSYLEGYASIFSQTASAQLLQRVPTLLAHEERHTEPEQNT